MPGRRDPRRVATAPARVTTRGTRPAPPRAYRPRGTDAARVRPRPRRSVFPWTCGVLAREELEPRSTSTSVKLNPRATLCVVSHRRNQSLSAISPRWAIADREKGIGGVPSSEWRRWNCRLELPVRDEWESGKSSAFFGFRQSRSVATWTESTEPRWLRAYESQSRFGPNPICQVARKTRYFSRFPLFANPTFEMTWHIRRRSHSVFSLNPRSRCCGQKATSLPAEISYSLARGTDGDATHAESEFLERR